jgi:hypothetical protein
MPVLPYITDTRAHLDDAVGRAAAAGASSVMYSALHLRPGVKPWWFAWLQRTRPDLVERYRSMYLDNTFAPKDYRRWLSERVRPILRAHGMGLGHVDPATGSMGFSNRLSDPGAAPATPAGAISGPSLFEEQSRPTSSPLKRADPGFDQRLVPRAAPVVPTLF